MGSTTTIERIAARQHGVFHRTQALEAGITKRQIQGRLEDGSWIRLDTQVYASAAAPATWERQLRAAHLSRPDALVTGRSAARLEGFANVAPSKPEILIPFTGNARSPLARVVRSRHYDLVAHKPIDGMRVTTLPETLLILGYTNPPGLIERWIDDLIAGYRLSAAEFDPIFARLTGARVRGLVPLGRIVAERDRDSYQPPTSELERLLYRLLDRDEFPSYSRQLPFQFDRMRATVDAYIEEWRVIVEGDGRRWHTRKADFERDRERDNAAAARGIQVIRFTYRMLKSDPDACAKTLISIGRHR